MELHLRPEREPRAELEPERLPEPQREQARELRLELPLGRHLAWQPGSALEPQGLPERSGAELPWAEEWEERRPERSSRAPAEPRWLWVGGREGLLEPPRAED